MCAPIACQSVPAQHSRSMLGLLRVGARQAPPEAYDAARNCMRQRDVRTFAMLQPYLPTRCVDGMGIRK
jgi:hypothetical protein